MANGDNVIIDSLEAVDSSLGLLGLFGGLEVIFVDCNKFAVETSGEDFLGFGREVQGAD
jgi:hypothetical protein